MKDNKEDELLAIFDQKKDSFALNEKKIRMFLLSILDS